MSRSPTELASVLRQIYAAGFEGAGALRILREAAVVSKGGLVDMNTAMMGTVAVLTAYRSKADKATGISNMLFRTTQIGRVTFEELANFIGNASSNAASLGINIVDVAAAVASLTRTSTSSSVAFNALNMAMFKFMDPTKELIALMKQSGYESSQMMFQTLGLAGTLQWLGEKTGGTVENLMKLGFSAKETRVLTKLAGDGAKDYAAALAELKGAMSNNNASTSAMNQINQSSSQVLADLKTKTEIFRKEIGDALMPVVKELTVWMTKLLDNWSGLSKGTKTVIVAFGFILSFVGPMMMAFGRLATGVEKLALMFQKLSLWMSLASGPKRVAAIIAAAVAITAAFMAIDALTAPRIEFLDESPMSVNMKEMTKVADGLSKAMDGVAESTKKVASAGQYKFGEIVMSDSEAKLDFMKREKEFLNDRLSIGDKITNQMRQQKELRYSIDRAKNDDMWKLMSQEIDVKKGLYGLMDELQKKKTELLNPEAADVPRAGAMLEGSADAAAFGLRALDASSTSTSENTKKMVEQLDSIILAIQMRLAGRDVELPEMGHIL
jgi:TP901 family phage tail tape measure protein